MSAEGLRVGTAVDAHRLAEGVPLVLGTIEIDHPEGLVGHSDGDVIAHALCDALLAAAGDVDIGVVFPSDDPEWRGVSGERMLRVVVRRLGDRGLRPVNAHATAICERPRLAPLRDRMQRSLSEIVGAPVSVHATTTDGMGFTGRGEGIACQAIALVESAS